MRTTISIRILFLDFIKIMMNKTGDCVSFDDVRVHHATILMISKKFWRQHLKLLVKLDSVSSRFPRHTDFKQSKCRRNNGTITIA